MVLYRGEMTAEDWQRILSPSRLIRTEISTLIGLLVKQSIDYSVPTPLVLRDYVLKTEALLKELHHRMGAVMMSSLKLGVHNDAALAPPSQGEMMREPIFYGGESAY